MLRTRVASDALLMSENDLPRDFDVLMEHVDRWLRNFRSPAGLTSRVDGGRRVVTILGEEAGLFAGVEGEPGTDEASSLVQT
jgi:hypothetical protein